MTVEIGIVLAIFGVAIVLFVWEKVRADVVAMLVLLALLTTGLLTVEEAFQGFASPAVVTVWAVFIISGGLQRSGVADVIARTMLRLAGRSEPRLLFFMMAGAGIMSAFMNNIGAVAILMPAVISVGRRLEISSSKLLMPLAFAALLGGNLTLIGTPPNILAVDIMASYGIEPFGFFDFLPTGIMVLAVGVLYMMFAGRFLIPARVPAGSLGAAYHVRDFVTEVRIDERSNLRGKRVNELNLTDSYNLNIIHVRSRGGIAISTLREYTLESDDTLLLEGKPEDIVNASDQLRLLPIADFEAERWNAEAELDDLHLAEVTLAPNSNFNQRTLKQIDFRDRYGLSVLALRHNGVDQIDALGDTPISFGDSLLVQGPPGNFDNLLNDANLLVLESPPIEKRRTRKIPLASVILLAVIVAAAAGWAHVAVLMLAGAMAMVLGGVLRMEEAYRNIDWKAVFLIAGMLPLGTAMESTGAAPLIADQLVNLTGPMGPVAVLATIFIFTALLTEVISNAAAAVLMVPIAIDVALALNVSPYPFIMATVIAASTSFLMPIGHQANIIVFGAGGYKFFDYARVGIGLNLLLLILVVTMLPQIWPL